MFLYGKRCSYISNEGWWIKSEINTTLKRQITFPSIQTGEKDAARQFVHIKAELIAAFPISKSDGETAAATLSDVLRRHRQRGALL